MNIEMIDAAATRIVGHAQLTPLLSSPFLDAVAGRRVLVKAECLQHTGSFKYRGARAALTALPKGTKGVLACSSGNHAQGVARAAAELGLAAVILMPADAPRIKLENTAALGAEVVTYDRTTTDRDAMAAELAEARGLDLILPFDNAQVIAGQGTVGLEIAAQAGVSEADVLVCCGGGGLTAGVALALEARAPGLRVRPVEPEGFEDVAQSLVAGRIITNPARAGLCDAVLTPAPGKLPFPILQRLCGPGLVVTDTQVLAAMALAQDRLKLVLEPGGAVALAAALFLPDAVAGDTVIAVATGGNVDREVFIRALTEGASHANRAA
ncbi:L-threonine dehydratase catabolic TdcB [Roseibaca ekhonensis]|jgi:threonine dehydratase|uniref:L-threonine dehydratase catabolic TdcB n=1 Tax=Roseinatronobacter ekhonensis TaxID=254356 RepID=A0A3B0MP41_9RHOB|nr:threonine/serine dehydratase [Roseibaca ekhonensis]SUZ31389.1 L-threonine dehydratase catabolic TdcB [Roseibaca ekhonensis]